MKTEISVCTTIMLNDHSNPYIESTTILSDKCSFSQTACVSDISDLILFCIQMAPLMMDRCTTLVTVLAEYADTDKSIEVFRTFEKLTMETIIAAAFGRVIDIQKGERNELVNAMNVIFAGGVEGQQFAIERISLLLSNFPWAFPILQMMGSHSKEGKAHLKLTKLALGLIKARRELPDAQNYKDLLQLMIDATAEERGEQRKLTNEEILSQSFTFIIAGYESTAFLLSYTAYLLAMNPELQDKLIDQIKEYRTEHPNASPYDMAQEIAYLDMVMQESLRLHSAAPYTNRHCKQTITIGRVTIPEGAEVVIPIHHIHHDAQLWPDPEKFDPNR